MSIAIYRLKKLNVAVLRYSGNPVRNFAPRWIRDVRLTVDPDGAEVVTVYFTSIQRRQQLVIHHDEVWQFRKGEFTIIHRHLRNGRIIREFAQPVGPLLNTFWCQENKADWVRDRLEDDQTGRCIVEQYLHEFTPNPDDYRVVTFDFSKQRPNLDMASLNTDATRVDRLTYHSRNVRPKVAVLDAAKNDRSESADVWMQLFEGLPVQDAT